MAPANCSHCGRSTSVPTRQSLNTALDPELKSRVKDGSLFVWECPYCGQRNLAQYPLLYHDPEAKLMVWLLFSIFPAVIAFIMALLAYKFPLKK